MIIGIVTIQDCASRGEYADIGVPTVAACLEGVVSTSWTA